MTALTDTDDFLHRPTSDDPYWTETVWFGANVPERGIGVNLYALTRTNLGVIMAGVYVWETGAEETWTIPHYRTFWHVKLPEGHDATNFALPIGLSCRRIEPMRSYQVGYDDPGTLTVDLTFRALHAAEPYGVADGYGHLDQIGRMSGTLELYGETIQVDCIDMRDRTWSPRRETSQKAHVGYTYGATSERLCFHLSSRHATDDADDVLTSGFLLDGGTTRRLVDGRRDVIRDARGRPLRVDVTVRDDLDRTHAIRGEVVSRFAFPTTPYFVWMSVVRWIFPDGAVGWGQDHDSWAPGRWRRFLRGRAAG